MAGGSHGPIKMIGRRQPIDVLLHPFRRFARFEAAGGVLLLITSVAALIWANSPYAPGYLALWEKTYFTVAVGEAGGFAAAAHHADSAAATLGHAAESAAEHADGHAAAAPGSGSLVLSMSIVHWINDLLMAVFFLLVGLEIKREILVGELASPRKAAVPIFAAIGGMAAPGAIFALINMGTPEVRGWGVPMATDIAFALGFLAILGRRVPLSLRVFLASLAIIDDLGALLVIAIFYTEEIRTQYLLAAGLLVGLLALHNALGVRRTIPYAVFGLLLWYAMYKSGVHATIAGVLVAMTIPARTRVDGEEFLAASRETLDDFERAGEHGPSIITNSEQQAAVQAIENYAQAVQTPLQSLEHALLPWVSFLIVPLFALANAGVGFAAGGGIQGALTDRVAIGIAAGLVLGKPIGIMLASWLAVRTGLGALPEDISWRQLLGMSCLAGIGFTMSLFIAQLAFPDPGDLTIAKVAVLGASAVSAVIGFTLLWLTSRAPAAA